MGWAAEAFRENSNLEHKVTAKIILFILKAVSAIAYIFVLGYLAAGGIIDGAAQIMLILGAVFDLVPEILTLRILDDLPKTAQQIEFAQLILAVLAYTVLVATIFIASPEQTFVGYALFAVLWILSFLIQESTFFLLEYVEE